MPIILSIQIGQPRQLGREDATDDHDKPWYSGFYKQPIAESVLVGREGMIGDGQADLVHHGGPDKAVLAYSAEHYPFWNSTLQRGELPYGAFGENLSVTGLDETKVCIGDAWQAGDVRFEVSQPRQPCWKLSRRWRIASLAAQVVHNGRSGWYLRVLEEGELCPGTELTLLARPHPDWTIDRANRLMHHAKHDLAGAAELASLPSISESWRVTLSDRLAKRASKSTAPFDRDAR